MILGLKVTIGGEELCQLCQKQADHHRARVQVYEQQIASAEANDIEGMEYTGGDPKKAFKDRQQVHQNAAMEMDFIGDHIDKSESYLLDRSDLEKLGVVKSRY